MVLPRFVPPAGTALRMGDLMAWARGAIRPAGELEALAAAFEARYDVPHVFFVSSGRAGMTVLLRTLAEAAGNRNEVVVPGYTCYSVAASAIRAGLRVRPLDIAAETLDYAPESLAGLDPNRVVALTSSSLYGIPADLPGLERFALERGLAFIDDAAQCLDGRVGGRWAGTFGDAGLFSFDKGKNITTMQGGVVVCRDDELALRLTRAFGALPQPPRSAVAMDGIKVMLYALLLRPALYWLPHRVLPLGDTPFDLEYPMAAYSSRMASLARQLLGRIDAITEGRVRTAEAIRTRIGGRPGMTWPQRPGARSVYPRLPVVFEHTDERALMLRRLVHAGIGATASYPAALMDVPGVRSRAAPGTVDTPAARRVAAGIMTLPTHPFVRETDLDTIARAFGPLPDPTPIRPRGPIPVSVVTGIAPGLDGESG
jgi:perosamine synthetase